MDILEYLRNVSAPSSQPPSADDVFAQTLPQFQTLDQAMTARGQRVDQSTPEFAADQAQMAAFPTIQALDQAIEKQHAAPDWSRNGGAAPTVEPLPPPDAAAQLAEIHKATMPNVAHPDPFQRPMGIAAMTGGAGGGAPGAQEPAPAPQASPPGGGGAPRKPKSMQQWLGHDDLRMQGMNEYDALAKTGAQAKMDAAHLRATDTAQMLADDNAERAKVQSDIERINADADNRSARLAKEVDALSKAKVDSNRLWHNASTGAVIANVIGMIGSGLANPNGGGQAFMNVIQSRIKSDVDDQMHDIENRRAGLSFAQQQMKDDLARGMDLSEVRLKAIAVKTNQTALAMEAKAGELGATAEAAALMQASAQMKMGVGQQLVQENLKRKEIASQNYGHAVAERNSQRALLGETLRIGQQAVDKSLDRGLDAAKFNAEKSAAYAARRVNAVSGAANGDIIAPKPEIADDLNKTTSVSEVVLKKLARMREIREQVGGGGYGIIPDKEKKLRAEAQSLFRSVAYDLSNAQKQGVLREGEWPNYEEMIGSPTDFWNDAALARLDAVRNDMIERVNAEIEDRTGQKLKTRWEPTLRPSRLDTKSTGEKPTSGGTSMGSYFRMR